MFTPQCTHSHDARKSKSWNGTSFSFFFVRLSKHDVRRMYVARAYLQYCGASHVPITCRTDRGDTQRRNNAGRGAELLGFCRCPEMMTYRRRSMSPLTDFSDVRPLPVGGGANVVTSAASHGQSHYTRKYQTSCLMSDISVSSDTPLMLDQRPTACRIASRAI